jgi:dihydrofolate reductase
MRKLTVFNMVSLDGYFVDERGDMSWAHKHDPEWNAFVAENASGGGTLLFGRITYQMMASYWPTPMASQNDPVVAKGMNELPKFVFSRTLDKATWQNTKLLKGDPAKEVRKLKEEPGRDLVVMGSGSIVAQLAQASLVDEYTLIVNPLVLGKGRSMFTGVDKPFALKPTKTRTFRNGNILLSYERA